MQNAPLEIDVGRPGEDIGGHARALSLDYTIERSREFGRVIRTFVFEDGVRYSLREALLLSKVSHADIREIHRIKKIFDGVILD